MKRVIAALLMLLLCLPAYAEDEVHRIGVIVYNTADEEVLGFKEYLKGYIEENFEMVQFVYSYSINSEAQAASFIQAACDQGVEKQGVDFWWIDWQQKGGSSVRGIDPLFMLNHTRYLYSARKGDAGLTFSRYAGPGSHRYPVGFSGDSFITWDSLAFQPYFTATAANIGYGWWSHDIGGHMHGIRDEELQTRWL